VGRASPHRHDPQWPGDRPPHHIPGPGLARIQLPPCRSRVRKTWATARWSHSQAGPDPGTTASTGGPDQRLKEPLATARAGRPVEPTAQSRWGAFCKLFFCKYPSTVRIKSLGNFFCKCPPTIRNHPVSDAIEMTICGKDQMDAKKRSRN